MKTMVVRNAIRKLLGYCRQEKLPLDARLERRRDRCDGLGEDHGIERSVAAAAAWLCRAQDHSASGDGGVARHYSLIGGWGASYPETTGYIVPTMLACARHLGDESLQHRARRMLDWLVAIQFPEGGFQGGMIGQTPRVPVTFNTGQILIGLAAGVREFGERYLEPMRKAADWLVATQDSDGCWRRHPTPFAAPGEKAYETHVAWGLLEAARVEQRSDWSNAALRNLEWALTHQRANGWFAKCCLQDEAVPLTHTLGYVLRGVLEAHRFAPTAQLLEVARRTADGLLIALRSDGFLPGRLASNWRGSVKWSCLTGSVQVAHCWLLLYQQTEDQRYLSAATAANRFVRRTINLDGSAETSGGIKGSWPVDGGYCSYQYPNWACKFFIDAQLLEHEVCCT
jgi:hypothetical protein